MPAGYYFLPNPTLNNHHTHTRDIHNGKYLKIFIQYVQKTINIFNLCDNVHTYIISQISIIVNYPSSNHYQLHFNEHLNSLIRHSYTSLEKYIPISDHSLHWIISSSSYIQERIA